MNKPLFKRVKTPSLLQMEVTECGAVSLGIIMAYYKKFLPLEELRNICGVTRNGSNALQIVKGAEKLGLEAIGKKKDTESLFEIKPPFIIFWNFNHFLVVEGFSRNKKFVYLNDPAQGPRRLPMEEFDTSYTGIVLEIIPTPSFQKSGSPPSLITSLKTRLAHTGQSLFFIALATLALFMPCIALSLFTQIFFDKLITLSFSPKLFFVSLALTIMLSSLLLWLQRYVLTILNAKLAIQWSSKFFWHVIRLPIAFFTQRYPGDIADRLLLNDTLLQIVTFHLLVAAANLLFVVLYFIFMLKINLILSLMVLSFALINVIALLLINKSRTNAFAYMQQNNGKNVGIAVGALQNMETIKSLGMESDFFARWAGYFAKVTLSQQEIQIKDVFLTSIPTLLQILTTASILFLGALFILNGTLTIGMLLALHVLIAFFLAPFSQFVKLGQVLQELKSSLRRIDDIFTNKEDPFLKNGKSPIDSRLKLDGYVNAKNLSFGYDLYAAPLIKDLHLSLSPGKLIALVGSTGCGKSTIIKLLSGLYYPWEGEILFDGKPISTMDRNLIIRSVGCVDQNLFIFEGSFIDNITLWDKTIFEEEWIAAAKDACLHDEILKYEEGYHFKIIEEGKNLSGGQKQKIEIARALVKNPTILFLDESTSSLDYIAEKRIIKNIQKRGCSCLLITNRLSTIKYCDEILVLEGGKISQKGTPHELQAIDGLYQKLFATKGSSL
ncbi:MAG: cysteine peptidase family C39 domain-containing protein [Chlamydiota bacterium]